jgi:DNA invertase Pin-like site-specific DNA recombinase
MQIGYARVSTTEQDFRLQLDALRKAACTRVFEEKASGAKSDRPELAKLLDMCRKGDVIVVWKLDRLARSMRQLVETVQLLEERGVQLRSLTESIDTTSAGGKLTFHIFGALAEFERSLIRERTLAGLAAARARGIYGGRPPKLSADDAAMARKLLKDGEPFDDLMRRFKVSRATLYNAGIRRHEPKPAKPKRKPRSPTKPSRTKHSRR